VLVARELGGHPGSTSNRKVVRTKMDAELQAEIDAIKEATGSPSDTVESAADTRRVGGVPISLLDAGPQEK